MSHHGSEFQKLSPLFSPNSNNGLDRMLSELLEKDEIAPDTPNKTLIQTQAMQAGQSFQDLWISKMTTK
jgi:hypothetical protein